MKRRSATPCGQRSTVSRRRPASARSGGSALAWRKPGIRSTYLVETGIRYVCDWVNDDQPYLFEIGTPPLVSLPYSVQTNDFPAYFEMKVSVPEFEAMLKRQFDTMYREGEAVPRVMAIAVHPFVTGQPHRIGGSTRRSSTSARMKVYGAPPAVKSCSIFCHSRSSRPPPPRPRTRVNDERRARIALSCRRVLPSSNPIRRE